MPGGSLLALRCLGVVQQQETGYIRDPRHVCRRTNLSRNQAYMLCSLIGDLRVTQTVDGNKGIHMLLAKRFLR